MAKTSASAEKPESAHLALSMLTKASVKTGGTWEVLLWNPIEDKYEYTWQGKPRQGTNFFCDLVSPDDPRLYLQAQFKKTSSNETKYQHALKTYVQGARFVMSKVGFVEDAKAAYVSCPLKAVVDLSKTKWTLASAHRTVLYSLLLQPLWLAVPTSELTSSSMSLP